MHERQVLSPPLGDRGGSTGIAIEPRILDADGQLLRNRGEQCVILLRKLTPRHAVQGKHAYNPAMRLQREGEDGNVFVRFLDEQPELRLWPQAWHAQGR